MNLAYTQNRELSWLKFNERVLDKALDKTTPLMERIKFLGIFISNLDEFFMIRVGSLLKVLEINPKALDSKTNKSLKHIIDDIMVEVKRLVEKKDEAFNLLMKDLKNEEIYIERLKELDDERNHQIKKYVKKEILPFLSPQILDFNHPFPHIENKALYLTATLKYKDKELLGLVQIPSSIKRIIKIAPYKFLLTYQIIYDFADLIFPNYKIIHKNIIAVTRNADLSFDDMEYEEQNDFKDIMKYLIKKRGKLNPVRLEAYDPLDSLEHDVLLKNLNLSSSHIFITKSVINHEIINDFVDFFPNNLKLFYPKIVQRRNIYLNLNERITPQILKHDALLFYPYEAMTPFLKLIKEASCDKNVVSIKITIYRLSKNSKLVDYLCQAAENGKDVEIIIELRARFDEQNNIDFSEKLEDAGCHIMYGFEHYKVHSKICLITRNINNKISYITQIGTGNYNEKTVNIYTDYSYITSNQEIGLDAANFFNNMFLSNLNGTYNKLLVAPNSLKSNLIKLISEQIELKEDGYIFLKVNSITDIDIINMLVRASQAGVKVEIIVRGICCILPNIKDHTSNIMIKSIVGRFLEHSRIYLFGKSNVKMYISSADMMTRNTVRRVEVAVPILDSNIKKRILSDINIMLNDTYNSRILTNNGNYQIPNSQDLIDCQNIFLSSDVKVNNKVSTKKMIINYFIANNIEYECDVIFNDDINITKKFNFYLPKLNTYISVLNKQAKVNHVSLEKWYLLDNLLKNNQKKLCLIFTSELNEEAKEALRRIKIEYKTIHNLQF